MGGRRGAIVPVLLAVVLAGCASPPDLAPAASTAATNSTGDGEPNATAAANASLPKSFRFYLTATHELTLGDAPPDGAVRDTRGALDPGALAGTAALAQPWPALQAAPVAYHVSSMRLRLVFSSATPQASTTQALGFGPVISWAGEEERWGGTNDLGGPASLMPGETSVLEADLALPPGGLVFEERARLILLVLLGYTQSDSAPIQIHVGAEGSRLDLVGRPYPLPSPQATTETTHVGELGPALFLLPPGTVPQSLSFPVTVSATTMKVEARLAGAGGPGGSDVDLTLVGPDGEAVAVSSSPTAIEVIRAYPPNLGLVGEYSLVVSSFHGASARFDLVVRVVEGGPDAVGEGAG